MTLFFAVKCNLFKSQKDNTQMLTPGHEVKKKTAYVFDVISVKIGTYVYRSSFISFANYGRCKRQYNLKPQSNHQYYTKYCRLYIKLIKYTSYILLHVT